MDATVFGCSANLAALRLATAGGALPRVFSSNMVRNAKWEYLKITLNTQSRAHRTLLAVMSPTGEPPVTGEPNDEDHD
jgi:hypothetical protein